MLRSFYSTVTQWATVHLWLTNPAHIVVQSLNEKKSLICVVQCIQYSVTISAVFLRLNLRKIKIVEKCGIMEKSNSILKS